MKALFFSIVLACVIAGPVGGSEPQTMEEWLKYYYDDLQASWGKEDEADKREREWNEHLKTSAAARLARKKAKEESDRQRRIAATTANRWPARFNKAVMEGKVFTGMTSEQVTASWGKPARVDRTVKEGRIHEEWFYGDTYLHFENGKLIKGF